MKVFVASFNRASNGVLDKLIHKMKKEGMITNSPDDADYIMAVGDRIETFDFTLKQFRKNKKIIHLWAGEISQGTHDEIYRHSITLMSCIQLCCSEVAANRVRALCDSVSKPHNVYVVGNLFLDNLEMDDSLVPTIYPYDLVLYNPPTICNKEQIEEEIKEIVSMTMEYGIDRIWLEPNGDENSDLIMPFVTHKNVERKKFLGLLNNCRKFITNSSSEYVEAPYLIKPKQIIHIGVRNMDRENKYSDMSISGASDKIVSFFKELKE